MAEKKIGGYVSFLKRVLIFVLAMLLGMALLVGAVAGTIYAAVSLVTLNNLEKVGVPLGEGLLTSDSILRDLSLLNLAGEVMSIQTRMQELTINKLVEEYGVILSDATRAVLPPKVLDIPLSDLTGEYAIATILENTTFYDASVLLGGALLPPAASEKINSRPLILLANARLGELFEGVYLADLIGGEVTVGEDGIVQPVVGEGMTANVVSYLGTIELGEYFSAEDNTLVINKALDNTPMSALLTEGENVLTNTIRKYSLGDILKVDQQTIAFDMSTVMSELYLGNVLGYELGEDDVWYKDGKAAAGIYRCIADLKVDELDKVDMMSRIDGVYVAELMGYEMEEIDKDEDGEPIYSFYKLDSEGNRVPPEGVTSEFVTMTVGKLRNEQTLESEIMDMQVGTAMGYTEGEDGIWRKDGEVAKGAFRPLLGKTVGNLDTELDRLYLGEVMGFDNIAAQGEEPNFRKDGNNDGDYNDAEDTAPGALMASFVSLKLSEIEDESKFTARVKAVRVGDAMGYTLGEDGKWYEGTKPVTGVFSTLSNYRVNEMNEAVKEMQVSTALGYQKGTDGIWRDENNTPASGILRLLMDSTLKTLSGDASALTVGEMMGYTEDGNGNYTKEGENGEIIEPSGPVAVFANMTLAELEDEDELIAKIDDMQVGMAMNYRKKDGKWYDRQNHLVKNPLLLAVVDKNVSQMAATMDTLTLGEAMGYTKREADGKWLKGDGETVETNTFILAIIDERVCNMEAVMDTLMVGELMGYTYVPDDEDANPEDADYYENGTWYETYIEKNNPGNKKVTGFVQIIKPETQVKGLNARLAVLNTSLTIGDLLDAKIVIFDTETVILLNTTFGDDPWQQKPINTFLNELIKKLKNN